MAAVELSSTTLYSDANLQEYYKLEDTSGKNGNTLTNNGTVTFSAAKFNNGANFGTTDANKTLTLNSNLSYGGGAYAYSFWVSVNTAPGSGVLYDLIELADTTTKTDLTVYYYNNSGTKQLGFGRTRRGTAADAFTYNVDLGTGTFYNIILTYNGTTVRGYVNNVDVGNVGSSGNGVNATTSKLVVAGQQNDLTANNGLVTIDDLAFFNRNLTTADINLIYNGPSNSAAFFRFF